jgi:hypothetical protein
MKAQSNLEEFDLGEELNRKILETVANAEARYMKGEILQRDFVTTLHTVNSIALGLYDNEVAAQVSLLLAENHITPIVHRDVFFNEKTKNTYELEYEEGSCQVTTRSYGIEGIKALSCKNYDDEVEGQLMALNLYTKTKAFLVSRYSN